MSVLPFCYLFLTKSNSILTLILTTGICIYYFYTASDGSAVFDVDLPKPELLPCGYIVGDVNSISVELKGITCFVCLY